MVLFRVPSILGLAFGSLALRALVSTVSEDCKALDATSHISAAWGGPEPSEWCLQLVLLAGHVSNCWIPQTHRFE